MLVCASPVFSFPNLRELLRLLKWRIHLFGTISNDPWDGKSLYQPIFTSQPVTHETCLWSYVYLFTPLPTACNPELEAAWPFPVDGDPRVFKWLLFVEAWTLELEWMSLDDWPLLVDGGGACDSEGGVAWDVDGPVILLPLENLSGGGKPLAWRFSAFNYEQKKKSFQTTVQFYNYSGNILWIMILIHFYKIIFPFK